MLWDAAESTVVFEGRGVDGGSIGEVFVDCMQMQLAICEKQLQQQAGLGSRAVNPSPTP